MKPGTKKSWGYGRVTWVAFLILVLLAMFLYALPMLFIWKQEYLVSQSAKPDFFPVTVNPKEKSIQEDPTVDAMLDDQNSTLSTAAADASEVLDMLASAIASTPFYEAVAATDARLVVVNPGYRKEEVAAAFGKALHWSQGEQKAFLEKPDNSPLALPDGDYSPGTYVVGLGAGSAEAQQEVGKRFEQDILSHYSTSTQAIVPLSEALTIASMLERETNDRNEMRVISGIMWNRIFTGMKLQIDATVQYAKASSLPAQSVKKWWPLLSSKDKFIKSSYNTYQNAGLPPAPISNPSVAAVIAALNPKDTSCLFYFHDKKGGFHCSHTYAEHVALLKQYYGQGK